MNRYSLDWQVFFWRPALSKIQDARKKGHVSLMARVAVALGAILWVFHGQDWAKLAEVFRQLNLWYFGLSLATFLTSQIIIAVRWWLLLRAQSIRVPLRAAIRLFFLGLFYNNLLPGSVGGDLLKAWYITKHTDKRLEGVLSVVVDRFVGLIGLVLMAVITYSLLVQTSIFGRTENQDAAAPGWLALSETAILWTGAALVVIVGVALVHPYSRRRLAQAGSRLWRRGIELLKRVKDALVVYCSKPVTLCGAFLLTFIAQSIVVVSFWLLGRNLGMQADLKYYFVIFPVMWVVGAIPVSIAGLGVVEAGTVGLFARLAGTPRELGTVLVLCQRFVWVLASLPGGLVHLLGAHLPREISIDGQKDPT